MPCLRRRWFYRGLFSVGPPRESDYEPGNSECGTQQDGAIQEVDDAGYAGAPGEGPEDPVSVQPPPIIGEVEVIAAECVDHGIGGNVSVGERQ